MDPKEKAHELFNKMIRIIPDYVDDDDFSAIGKKGALIAVDEILETSNDVYFSEAQIRYWEEVKKEIESL